jgi:hypothetical protein
MGALNLSIDWKAHRWAIAYCLVATIGACCYGYDVGCLTLDHTYCIEANCLSLDSLLHRYPGHG